MYPVHHCYDYNLSIPSWILLSSSISLADLNIFSQFLPGYFASLEQLFKWLNRPLNSFLDTSRTRITGSPIRLAALNSFLDTSRERARGYSLQQTGSQFLPGYFTRSGTPPSTRLSLSIPSWILPSQPGSVVQRSTSQFLPGYFSRSSGRST